MNTSKTFQFQQRWRALEKRVKDLDYERSVLARDIRVEFPHGTLGDTQFVKWCNQHLGISSIQVDELLTRARALEVCADEKTYAEVGGFKAVRHTIGLSKKEQVAVLQAAKLETKDVRRVIRERASAQGLLPKKDACRTPASDVRVLARYLADTVPDLPRHIQRIVDHYIDATMKAAA